jgi:pyruvate/2-oxoglutarate dehydrogenase complex dihydrolipoamide dehydrogenase (E3) component
VPPIPGLDQVPFLTNETVFDLRENVPHLIVVGAGPIGCELAQAFRRLGSEVEVVDIAPAILPKEDPDLAEVVFRKMRDEGIRFHLGMSIASALGTRGEVRIVLKARDDTISTLQGTHLLLAAGRKANIEDLGLDAAGVKVDKGRIVVDGCLRTTNPDVYVAGDVAGGFQFTHVAENHAGVVLRQTLFRLKWTKPSSVVPWCTYTDPELARVGLSETEAQQRNIAHQVYRFPFEEVDRARAEGETEGFAKLVTDPKGRLLGAGIVGAHAGELITECVLAITQGLKAGDLSAAIHAYPTLASIVRRAADQRQKQALTPASKIWIKRIFRLRGS